jgi:hypothetical protein
MSTVSDKRYAAAALASVSLPDSTVESCQRTRGQPAGSLHGQVLGCERRLCEKYAGLQLGKYPTPVEATGISLIGIALAMRAWSPQASDPASTA